MAFRPGQSGNPNGRAPGSKNKVSLRTREGIWKHIEQLAVQGKEANPFATLINRSNARGATFVFAIAATVAARR